MASFLDQAKVQAFGDILDATVESIPGSGENVEITQTFTYISSVIYSSTGCEKEVNRRLVRAWSAIQDESVWHCGYFCKWPKVRLFRSLFLPVLMYSCETWTLTGEVKRRVYSFGTI